MIEREAIKKLVDTLQSDAENSGYLLTTEEEFLYDLAEGLLVNEERYGYQACPCRRAKGEFTQDKDIICPCDYRDEDLNEFGSCYCGLYISEDILQGKKEFAPIPDRRLKAKENELESKVVKAFGLKSKYPIWRCTVCGYLCARTNPPEKCPICKVQKERFEVLE